MGIRKFIPWPAIALTAAQVMTTYDHEAIDYSTYVSPFVGTTGGGNMFPGVSSGPFAVVKLGPDVSSGTTDAYSGYLPSGNITGFSMLHESGTGGAPKYGVVSQMPVAGRIMDPLADFSMGRRSEDLAEVGYYKSSLANGVTVELAATNHAGVYQYTFPSEQTNSIYVDITHVLPSFRGFGWGQEYRGRNIAVTTDGRYTGEGSYNKGWNLSPDWTIYFCGKFSEKPQSARVFKGSNITEARMADTSSVNTRVAEKIGGIFEFDSSTVTSYVGVSWISTDRACEYMEQELSGPPKFEDVVQTAKDRWNNEVFSKITTSSTNDNDLKLLYTALYGMHLIPSNRTGENPLWTSNEPYYDDIFTFWDLFRCSTALTHVLQPEAYEEQIRSIIDIWRHDGFMPDGRSSNFNGRTQGGSNADNVLADAYVKGVQGSINWEDGYSAIKEDAETQPPNNNDPIAPEASTKEGRGALPDWLKYGYITPSFTRAVSRSVEYSVNDFSLYQVATGLGKTADAQKYLDRSRNWRNHWNPDASSNGHSGFMVPRKADGSFVDQDPLSCGGCYWGDAYYQGLPWEYSMNAHHDFAHTTELVGGTLRMVDRLEKMFEEGLSSRAGKLSGTIFNPANEPSFTTPYLYNFVGRQDLAVQRSRYVAKTFYTTATNGIPGNSDAGAMQTWLLWNMIGLYPLTGQTTFLIGSPWFESMSINLGNGRALKITSSGGNSDTAYYVQSLRVNGENWTKNWLTWSDVFENGGTMEFVLGTQAKKWDTGDPPPSPASDK
ncbi:glycosyl hydrolase [Pseudovirgaria hyperparasitica]|uniref:Glycosyl hydrolase n=1 Tax=Pseudovirgaria hyperparasitica TaxID=470096 RepID=A0A6A6W239_9PEZI|nr:glycosyl hydrolase [Pseudovirgaria hyperparasitica]KAF2755081.1 glycosyl hydrolase [Pseudovirgaria hyperparasitica]